MDLVINGKNIDVPDNAKEYIRKKARKFDRHLQSISKAKVELSEEKTRSRENRYIAEVTIDAQGIFLRGEERGPDIFSAVDAVASVMERQIRRFKDRRQGKKRQRTHLSKKLAGKSAEKTGSVIAGEEEGAEDEALLIKFKRFPVSPISPHEAIEQMEFLGHDFHLFFNSEIEKFCVVYKRDEGGYGLLEPELD